MSSYVRMSACGGKSKYGGNDGDNQDDIFDNWNPWINVTGRWYRALSSAKNTVEVEEGCGGIFLLGQFKVLARRLAFDVVHVR